MDTNAIQREARALGDPTRYRLFRYIVDSDRPVGVAELTTYVELNHNAVRQHLAVLKDADLVVEEVEARDSPGRPRLLYRLHPEAAGKWETSGPYAWLAGLLGEAVKHDLSSREVGRQDGLQRANESSGIGDSVDTMERELIRGGFRPTRSERGRQVDFVLARCPFEPLELMRVLPLFLKELLREVNDRSLLGSVGPEEIDMRDDRIRFPRHCLLGLQ